MQSKAWQKFRLFNYTFIAFKIMIMEDYNKRLKQRIREVREQNKISQQQAADELGISRNAYIAMEIGKTTIVNENYLKFAQKYDESFTPFVSGYVSKDASVKREKALSFEYEKRQAEIIQHYENLILEKDKHIAELQKQILEHERTERNLNDYIDRYIRFQAVSSTGEND